ncbi:MAG: c-type cytochrome [Leptospiraceae bacterium]|nr:c-type cytochrome [Leptospiraceae bacterium]
MSDPNKLFDGIAQADNRMPVWYTWSFVATMIIGVCYLGYYHVATDFQQEEEYAATMAEYKEMFPEKEVVVDASKGNPLAGNPEAIAAGEQTFQQICAACHKADGTGLIGPNLTDKEWLHGNSDVALFNVIMEGVSMEQVKQNPPKGPMPPHKASLGAEKVWQVIAYLQNKNKNIKSAGQ